MSQKICIFGASGTTGITLTQLALNRGLEVVAFVRSEPAKAKVPPGATVFLGDICDYKDVERALIDCTAAICIFGPRPNSTEAFCADATKNIIEAMKVQNVRRLICVTGAMIGNYPHLSWFMRSMKNSYQKQQPRLAQDRAEQEQHVSTSDLDWTVVKPPRLTNGKARGRVKSGVNVKVGAMSNISRADLSEFMLDQLEGREYVGKQVVVQN